MPAHLKKSAAESTRDYEQRQINAPGSTFRKKRAKRRRKNRRKKMKEWKKLEDQGLNPRQAIR